jgi:hypothetical protein
MERVLNIRLFFFMLSLTALFLYNACVKPPDYPKEPVIEFASISKQLMKQGKNGEDSISVTFNYTDGDGDLGFPSNEPGTSIFVRDGRDSFLKYEYKIPYIEPQGTGNGISGTININIPTSCCIQIDANGTPLACELAMIPFDTIQYLIRIKDRAGNLSNEIVTPPIRLKCQ